MQRYFPMLDCFGAVVELGDTIAYGTNSGQRVGKVIKIRTALDVWGKACSVDDWRDNQVVSITIKYVGKHTTVYGRVQTISNPEEKKTYIVKKAGPDQR